jgi:hypothetical protein
VRRVVLETRSPVSGRIRVIEDRRERRLVVAGETLSVYPLDGDWTPVRHEYWWHAVAVVTLPPRPSALLVGLGGGTQVHLLRALVRARRITIVERDPVIVQVACDWFGLGEVEGLEFLCEDAEVAVPALARAGRRFDFVMEDAAYADQVEDALPLVQALAGLVSPRGALVVNRHRRGPARRVANLLRPLFREVFERRVRSEAENVLICGQRPARRRASGSRVRAGGSEIKYT